MKLLFSLFLTIFFFGFGDAIGQNLIIKNDTIPFGTDSIATLILPQYRGQMLWQVSFDNKKWISSIFNNRDTLKINLDINNWYRAQIIDGACDTIYSDTIRVMINDSVYSDSTEVSFPVAYPGISGEIVDVAFGNDTIRCEKINDEYIFQGDIVLTENQIRQLSGNKGAYIPTDELFVTLWPDATVYYTISPHLAKDQRILDAIEYWKNNTPINFKEKVSEENFVEFVWVPKGCSSNIGMSGGRQLIRVSDNFSTYDLRHEIGHTIGLLHEQSRKDRGNYIVVLNFNIIEDKRHNFEISPGSLSYGTFDFNSLMLYPCYNSFAILPGTETMVLKETGLPWNDKNTANPTKLSEQDKETVKFLYANRPFVNTAGVSILNGNIAVCNGNVINDGGSEVTERGICWDNEGDPSINTNKTMLGSGLGRFAKNINDLQLNTNYYVRAYAKNRKGVSYGNIENFSTIGLGSPPTIITLPMSVGYYASKTGSLDSVITYNYGEVVEDGGFPTEKRGICWNLVGDPNTADDNLYDPFTGKGKFILNLKIAENISYDKNYYLRAFGKNLKGTSYGNVITFIVPKVATLLPNITTNEITDFTQTTADVGGNLSGLAGIDMISRGICWNTAENPNIHDNQIIIGNGLGDFSTEIGELVPNTTYFIRAFAKFRYNGADYYYEYGTEQKFTTLVQVKPSVSTSKFISFTKTTATAGGNITYDGGAPIILRGVCWSTSEWPTLSNSNDKTLDGGGTGIFSSILTNLTPNTKYYVRAYATNTFDTGYGQQETFTTRSTEPLVSTMPVSNLTQNTVILNGTVSSDGGAPISSRGFYWCQGDREPTLNDTIVFVSGTTGNFNKQLTGLLSGTLYSFKAFASNNVGTAFGLVLLFATDAAQPVSSPSFTSPANYAIFNKNNTSSATIQWNSVSGANEYWLNVFPSGQAASPIFNVSVGNTTSKALTINTLENGIYVIQVKARTTGGEWSNYSQTREFIVDTPPSNPILASPANETNITSNTQQTFSWAAPSGNMARYYLRIVSGTNLNATPVYENEFAATSINVNCSWAAGTYSWSVRAMKVTPEGYLPTSYETTIGWGSYATTLSFTVKDALTLPIVTTNSITDISQTIAVSGGYITSNGGAEITARGVCWSTVDDPITANNKTTNGTGTGNFTSNLTGLTANTKYFVWAYATNSVGIGYGNQETFTTNAIENLTGTFIDSRDGKTYKWIKIGDQTWMAENLAYLPFTTPSNLNSVTEPCYYDYDINTFGALYNWFAASCACPSEWHLPTNLEWDTFNSNLGDNVETVLSNGLGGYHYFDHFSQIGVEGNWWTNIEYDTSSALKRRYNPGVNQLESYPYDKPVGNSVRCIKGVILPSASTKNITNITHTTATGGSNVISDGGATVTSRGVCWRTSENPTTANNRTTDGSGTGSFTSNLTGLTANTTYYVRAYATNSAGTSYGNQVSFKTSATANLTGTFTDSRDGKIYKWVKIGDQTWMAENLAYLPSTTPTDENSLTEPCYYDFDLQKYGALYNWPAAFIACPNGWHLPTDSEWNILEDYLILNGYNFDGTNSGNKIAKSLASVTDWFFNPNITYEIGAISNDPFSNNSSGFSALPGGRYTNKNFYMASQIGYWWSSSEDNSSNSVRTLSHSLVNLNNSGSGNKDQGMSIRCIKD